jgi:hypothetical protein
LADNGFFDAKHSVSFNNGKKVEINTLKQLEEMIAKEKDAITKDKVLRENRAKMGIPGYVSSSLVMRGKLP